MTIDTLEYVKELEAAGVDRRQAEARARAVRDTVAPQLATKADIDRLAAASKADVEALGARLQAQITLLQWMLGFNLAATMAVLWKLLR